jgi:hypothetical protein
VYSGKFVTMMERNIYTCEVYKARRYKKKPLVAGDVLKLSVDL